MNSVLKEDTESVSKTSTNINIIEHETKTDIKEYSESIIKKIQILIFLSLILIVI